MTDDEQPPFMKAVPWAAIIIGVIIAIIIVTRIQWDIAVPLYGWDTDKLIRDTALLVGWGIVVPAIVITLAIVGSKIYEQTEYITLIFGIAFAVIGTLIAIMTGIQIGVQIGELVEKSTTAPAVVGFYPFFIIGAILGVVFGLMIGFKGKDVINYYYEKKAT